MDTTHLPVRLRVSKASLFIAFFLLVAVALAGCGERGSSMQPQILTFNYSVQSVTDATALIASVQNGQTTVSNLIARNQCNFTASFAGRTPPQVFPYGAPGQNGFNVNIVSTSPDNISTTNPSSCAVIDEFEINIGDRSQALALGTPTNRTNGRVWLDDGSQYQISEFFQATVQTYDPNIRRTSGSFRFIDHLSPASNKLLIVEGTFAMTP